jgi:tetratricopeptide (TPR) repeat protein
MPAPGIPLPSATGGGPGSAHASASAPTSFCDGRYAVKRFLGEGGKKLVYLAHDAKLDRDVAFALIKTEGLDHEGQLRITREAQAMGRLGDHPNIVPVYDIGEEANQPYLVTQLMGGGDVEGLIEAAADHRVPLPAALKIADEVCQALEYAHARGIVHRDLKPGNVWLTADGTAKLGDFGLAVALDKTRLTKAGMMVGTVSYMPPEQAIGGEVTPRSDLYSLGAMLYELVTGRPPFVGDESVAIITQHLNTPPIAPSWHAPDLPSGLEALILLLLEKDPQHRPASAGAVRTILASLAPSATAGAGPAQPGAGEVAERGVSPVYRRVFVGREAELRQLQTAFDTALAGVGAIAMVVGEPGIGKTSLCEQLATHAAVRGGRALIGHCYEEGSLSLPYLPFVEALRSYVLAREPDDLRRDLGSGAAEVARLISEVRDRIAVELRPAGDPEDDRWRLLQAVTGFLKNASAVQPLLIVLEDLHDADRGTLDLLLHLSRNLHAARLLIVGTYRDVEVDRSHPLSSALAELRRSAGFARVPLRGLTVDEVHRMYTIIRGQEVPWSRAEAIHRQTEGNPLFVQEVLRYLVEEGLVVREGGRYALTDAGADAGIPEGLRDVVGKRLSRLSERANQVLSVASVIGRDFRLDVLQRVAALSEDEVIEALEEAQERAVIEERSAAGGALVCRFTHAFFRQTLYEEIFAARRIRWHQQVARALEAVHVKRLEEHAAELAEHFAHSSDPADLQKAVAYAELAARRAMSVFAYGEAVRHWGQALKAQDVLDPDDRAKHCDLLLAQGEAMLPLEEPAKIAESVATEAFALAEAIADSDRAARAALLALEALIRFFPGAYASPQFEHWAARADEHAAPGSAQRVYADIYMGVGTIARGQPPAGHVYLRKAMDEAFELNDNAVIFAAAGWAFGRLHALRDRELVDRLAREVLRRPREGARGTDLGNCLYVAGIHLLSCGDREGAEAAWVELRQLAEHTRDMTLRVWAKGGPGLLAFVDGRIDEAIALFETAETEARDLGTRSGIVDAARLPFYLGRGTEQALAAFDIPVRPIQAHRALILALLGRHTEAQAIRERFGDIGSQSDESADTILFALFEAAILGSDEATTRALSGRLTAAADRLMFSSGYFCTGSTARLLGEAAVLLGQPKEARAHYQQALDVCAKVRFRPESAITRLLIAELLLEHYPKEQAEAQVHLEFAIDEFRAMKMQPYLERALRHKGLLHA